MVETMTTEELRSSVMGGRARLDAAEFEWLSQLAEFDIRQGWRDDAYLSGVTWLVARCGMAYGTAKEKLRVAHAMRRRPVIAAAVAGGGLSYCKVRAITRITDVDDETDEALVAAARTRTVADLEDLVRAWRKLKDQDRPDRSLERWMKRGVQRIETGIEGMDAVRIVGPSEDIHRLLTLLDACARAAAKSERAVRAVDEAGDRVSCEATAHDGEPVTWAQRRYDAFADLMEGGAAYFDEGGMVDAERVVMQVVIDYEALVERAGGGGRIVGGPHVTGEEARRLACDAGFARVIVKGESEIVDVGRKTRQWTTAQGRAIKSRHDGRCAVDGCRRRVTEIHHTDPWRDGGETNIDLGIPLCPAHHRLVHELGWEASYDPLTGITTLASPDGRVSRHRSTFRVPRIA